MMIIPRQAHRQTAPPPALQEGPSRLYLAKRPCLPARWHKSPCPYMPRRNYEAATNYWVVICLPYPGLRVFFFLTLTLLILPYLPGFSFFLSLSHYFFHLLFSLNFFVPCCFPCFSFYFIPFVPRILLSLLTSISISVFSEPHFFLLLLFLLPFLPAPSLASRPPRPRPPSSPKQNPPGT